MGRIDVGVVPWMGEGEVLGVGVGSLKRDRELEEEFGLAVGEIGVPCRPLADWVGDGPCVVAGEGCMADGSEDGRGDVGAYMPIT